MSKKLLNSRKTCKNIKTDQNKILLAPMTLKYRKIIILKKNHNFFSINIFKKRYKTTLNRLMSHQ